MNYLIKSRKVIWLSQFFSLDFLSSSKSLIGVFFSMQETPSTPEEKKRQGGGEDKGERRAEPGAWGGKSF